MHRDKSFGPQFDERTHRLLRIHVHFPAGRRVIRTNRQQGDVYIIVFTDFPEPREEGGVSAMKNRSVAEIHREAAESAVQIGQEPRAPMIAGSQRHFDRADLNPLPVIKLVHDIKTEIVNQITDADRNNDRLIGGDFAQGSAVEVIEVRVRHQNDVDVRKMLDLEARFFQTLYNLQPLGPDRVDQHVDFMGLDEKRGMADPGNTDFARLYRRKLGRHILPRTLYK